jgi:hypothetical protein
MFSFLNIEQKCGPLAVEMVPGKHCDFSTYLAKRSRAQSGACAEVQFPDYGTVLLSPGSRNCSRETLRLQLLCCKSARDQSGACAELQFPDYGTQLWYPGSGKFPGYTAISAPILPREREISLAHKPRCNFLIIEHSCDPLAVELVSGKHHDFSIYLGKRARAQSGACA